MYETLGFFIAVFIVVKVLYYRGQEETLLDYRRIRDYENRNW